MLATLGLTEKNKCKNSYFHAFIPHAIQLDTSAFLVSLQTFKVYQVQPKEEYLLGAEWSKISVPSLRLYT